ncbi:MAG: hypothetical protein MJ016_07630 [Victivallaceae bacterium]|nr:hypothetical protein [Victivallaceae bacterium]
MKRVTVFLLTAVLGAALFAAESTTLREIRSRAFVKRAPQDCKSCEIIYTLNTGKGESGSLVFRQKTPNLSRIDILGMQEMLSAGFDGSKYWVCRDQQSSALSEEDINEYIYDAAFLAIPVEDVNLFTELVPDGEETISGVACNVYRAAMREDASVEMRVAVAKTDGLLRRVTMLSPDDKYITDFSDYVDKDGVMVASRIYGIGVEDTITLTLRKAAWDTNADDALFTPAGKPTAEVATSSAGIERKIDASNDHRIIQLRTDIKVLEEKIAAESKKLGEFEAVYQENQKQENALTMPPVSGVVPTTHRYRRLYRRTMHYHNRAIKKLMREDKKLAREHDAINEKILKLRSELVKKQQELAALTEGK